MARAIGLSDCMVAGWEALLPLVLVGGLVALALIIAPSVSLEMVFLIGSLVALAGLVQLASSFAFAGRLMKQKGLRS